MIQMGSKHYVSLKSLNYRFLLHLYVCNLFIEETRSLVLVFSGYYLDSHCTF